jgi:hypothetical protein
MTLLRAFPDAPHRFGGMAGVHDDHGLVLCLALQFRHILHNGEAIVGVYSATFLSIEFVLGASPLCGDRAIRLYLLPVIL